MSEEDDIIAGMREEYNRTNIQELNLLEQDNDLVKRVGLILQNSPEKHDIWNTIGFDPMQNQLVRKLISPDMIQERIRAIRCDYFKTVLYVDFFTRFVVPESNIVEEMKRRTRELEEIDSFLDPNLELCIRCCALDYLGNYRPIANRDRRKDNYRRNNPQIPLEYVSLRAIDPIYEAAGKLMLDQFTDEEIKQRLPQVSTINDLAAMAFIDMNLTLYRSVGGSPAQGEIIDLLNMVDEQEYLKAAHYSIDLVARRISGQPIRDYISTMQPTTY